MLLGIFAVLCVLLAVDGRKFHKHERYHLYKNSHITGGHRSLVFRIPNHVQKGVKGCKHGGILRKHGEVWSPGPCIPECHCINGGVTCSKLECPDLNCKKSIRRKWKCCPECPPITDRSGDKCGVRTISGNANSSCCNFPFKYNGVLYYTCTYQHDNKPWCAVTANYDRDGVWGACIDDSKKKTKFQDDTSSHAASSYAAGATSQKFMPKILPTFSVNSVSQEHRPLPALDPSHLNQYANVPQYDMNAKVLPNSALKERISSIWRKLGFKQRAYNMLSKAGGQIVTVALPNGGFLPKPNQGFVIPSQYMRPQPIVPKADNVANVADVANVANNCNACNNAVMSQVIISSYASMIAPTSTSQVAVASQIVTGENVSGSSGKIIPSKVTLPQVTSTTQTNPGQGTGGQVSGGQVTEGQVTGGQVTGGHGTGGQVTGGQGTGGQVTGGQVTGGQVTGGQVTGGQVTGGQVTGGQVSGSQVTTPKPATTAPGNGSQVTGGQVTGSQVTTPNPVTTAPGNGSQVTTPNPVTTGSGNGSQVTTPSPTTTVQGTGSQVTTPKPTTGKTKLSDSIISKVQSPRISNDWKESSQDASNSTSVPTNVTLLQDLKKQRNLGDSGKMFTQQQTAANLTSQQGGINSTVPAQNDTLQPPVWSNASALQNNPSVSLPDSVPTPTPPFVWPNMTAPTTSSTTTASTFVWPNATAAPKPPFVWANMTGPPINTTALPPISGQNSSVTVFTVPPVISLNITTIPALIGNTTEPTVPGNTTAPASTGNAIATAVLGNSTVPEVQGNTQVPIVSGNTTEPVVPGNTTVSEVQYNTNPPQSIGDGVVNNSGISFPSSTGIIPLPATATNVSELAQIVTNSTPQQDAAPYSSASSYPDPFQQQEDQSTGGKAKQSEDSTKANEDRKEDDPAAHLYEYMTMQPPSEPLVYDPYESQRRSAQQARELAESYNIYLKNYYASNGYKV